MLVLLEDEYVCLARDLPKPIVRVTRSSKAFPSAEEYARYLDGFLLAFAEHVPPAHRRVLGVMVDARAAPFSDDSLDAVTVAKLRSEYALFARSAILVKTLTGKMQATRASRALSGTTRVFDDEREALDWLESRED